MSNSFCQKGMIPLGMGGLKKGVISVTLGLQKVYTCIDLFSLLMSVK